MCVCVCVDPNPTIRVQLRGGDGEAMRQAHVNMIAGACLAMALRFAGSANALAWTTLKKYLLYFIRRRKAKTQQVKKLLKTNTMLMVN